MTSTAPATIDAYIAEFPPEIQEILQSVRRAIHEAAPEAQEAIRYGIPTFILNGNLVHFAAFKRHIGFYPAPTGMEEFREDLSKYSCGKGSVQFPLDQPIPLDLIQKITRFRVQENLSRPRKSKSGAHAK